MVHNFNSPSILSLIYQIKEHIFTRDNIIGGINQSLKRMKTDYLDLVQLHASPSKELIERDDVRYGKGSNTTPMSVQKRVMKDVVDCENSILAVCQGRFTK